MTNDDIIRIYSEVNLANKIKFGDSLTANTDRSFERVKNIIQKSKENLMAIHFKYKNDVKLFFVI